MNPLSKDKLCTVNVVAGISGTDLIGSSHAANYMNGAGVHSGTMLHQLQHMKQALDKLRELIPLVDDLIDECEGRKPPVKVDEQVAA